VHAVALVNLAEVASGTAMLTALPPGTRGIVTGLSMTYLKKARGTLTAECRCNVPTINGERKYDVHADVRDESGDVVATATVHWLLRSSRVS
jgi:acyl-coenzyme A thioesterase PaaI-like protein